MIDGAPVRTLIVEDEPLARRAMRGILAELEWIDCVGEAVDAEQASLLITMLDPELIFLDVQLPAGNGIEVLERTRSDAAVIFATAFDGYALAAFELGAVDYVTKPFGAPRVHRALARAMVQVRALRETRRGGGVNASSPREPDVPRGLSIRARFDVLRDKPLTTIFVRERGLVVPISVTEIVRCEADGDFVAVHARGKRYLVYLNLGDLAKQLAGANFVRVHRSHLVNLAAVESIETLDANRVELRMRDASRVAASRTGTRALRERMRGS